MAATLIPKKWEEIAGRYRLEREIARGGMGSVWEGYDKKLRRKVAVKLVPPDVTSAADARERFEREAMAVAQLQSPHVVQVFDYGVEKQCPYIVMELLEGEDLRGRLYQVKRVTLETAGHILVQTAKALSAAHAAGIVHRDLKPGNIFLVKNGEEEIAKILDFGVAKQLNSDELVDLAAGEGTIMGTPQFMSPEQAHGLTDVDHRADLWALGVIVYRALTGKLPFHAPTPTEVIVQVCTVAPIPVSVRAPDLPRELDDFFARALAKNRQHRFQSAREMAMAFSRISPVNFTTLSMPDPGPAIEQALRRAAEDDDAETIAVDALSAAALVDLETRIHQSAHPLPLPAPRPPPPSRRGPPKLPPRRSKPPDTLRSPASSPLALSPSAAPPPTDSAPDIPTPARGLPPHAAALAAAVATPPSSAPVAAAGLFDAGPAEPGSYTPHGVTRAATEPSDPGRDDLELDALVPTSSRPTWLLALAAVLVGVAMAIVGSVVLRDEASQASTPPAETDTSVDETPATPPPNDPAEPNQDERADPPDSDEPDEAALDGGEAAAEPSADTAADSRKPPRPWPRGGRMVAPPPPLQPAPAPAPEPPPPAPAPTPKPEGGDDPFADRL